MSTKTKKQDIEHTETIRWIDVADDTPDDDIVVLVKQDGGDVFSGYLDDCQWRTIEGWQVGNILRWAEMPTGERAGCQP